MKAICVMFHVKRVYIEHSGSRVGAFHVKRGIWVARPFHVKRTGSVVYDVRRARKT